jgi:hypothetical protein
VTPSASSITTTQPLTVTVAVNGGTGNPTPTGSVTLTGGGYTSAATTLSSKTASINIPAGSLATGNDTLTVSYIPDSNSSSTYNSAAGSNSVTVTIPAKTTPTVTVTQRHPGAHRLCDPDRWRLHLCGNDTERRQRNYHCSSRIARHG